MKDIIVQVIPLVVLVAVAFLGGDRWDKRPVFFTGVMCLAYGIALFPVNFIFGYIIATGRFKSLEAHSSKGYELALFVTAGAVILMLVGLLVDKRRKGSNKSIHRIFQTARGLKKR